MSPSATAFEDRLLDVLLDRFDDLTPTVTPLRHRLNVRRYALPAGGLAAAAVAAAVMVELGGSATQPPAARPMTANPLADWSTKPTPANPAQTSSSDGQCSAALGQPGRQGEPAERPGPPVSGGPWSRALVDTRGNLTLALYSDGTRWMICLNGPSFVWLSSIDGTSESPVAENHANLDRLSFRGSSAEAYTIAVGTSGSAVTGVGLERTDGSVVSATVGDGLFLAWWPEDEGVTALSVTTSAGTQRYPVDSALSRSDQPANKTVQLNPSAQSHGQSG